MNRALDLNFVSKTKCRHCKQPIYDNGTVWVHRFTFRQGFALSQWCQSNAENYTSTPFDKSGWTMAQAEEPPVSSSADFHPHPSGTCTACDRAAFARGMAAGDSSSARMAIAVAVAAADAVKSSGRDFLGDALLAQHQARQDGDPITLGDALRSIVADALLGVGADIEHAIVHRDDPQTPEACNANFLTLDIPRVCRLPKGHAGLHSVNKLVSIRQPFRWLDPSDLLDLPNDYFGGLELDCQVCGDLVLWKQGTPGDHTGWIHDKNRIAQCHPGRDRDDYATPVVRMAARA
ncbi:MAG: hypothetical protein JWO13_2246 [Acidobacteriales bacterium]|nr:hypothetical protein [Terriglobales bacterium]